LIAEFQRGCCHPLMRRAWNRRPIRHSRPMPKMSPSNDARS
jgi:hypothetical protein